MPDAILAASCERRLQQSNAELCMPYKIRQQAATALVLPGIMSTLPPHGGGYPRISAT
jgi:hypothetical protein